jgi:hypothetical protein
MTRDEAEAAFCNSPTVGNLIEVLKHLPQDSQVQFSAGPESVMAALSPPYEDDENGPIVWIDVGETDGRR